MSTPIDSLEIQIKSSSQSAVSGIDALANSLNKLKSATKGGLGLTSVSKQLSALNSSLSSINATSIANIKGVADAIKILSGVKVSSSIGNQIKNIGTALSSLNIGDGATKIQELVSALKPLETLGKSSLGTTVNALRKLPEALKNIDTRQLYTQIQSLTRIFQPLGTVMQQVANGFNAFPSRIQRLIASNDRLVQSNQRTSTSYINLWAKMRMAYNGIRTATRLIASAISKMNDYIENVNLFTASMGEYADEAKNYAEYVGEIMGIDPGEWMRNQGVFMTLATGFGVVGDRAYTMSKNLTQLGYDISSFFNIPYEDAMLKLQSGLAGELEPLRRIGYDLSVARLQQEAYTLGINKKVSAMTQAEKAELRYYAIMTQVTTAQGDMARTLNAPANQLRILTAQFNMAARAIGSIFIPALNAILPYAIAVAKVIRILASTIASLFGFKMPEVDYSSIGASIGGAADSADSLGSGLGNAADNAKKLQKYSMGFDELNVIDPSSGSGGGGAGGAGVGGGGSLDFDLPEYDFLGNAVDSKVGQIVEDMKEWLGITDDINSWSELMDTRLGNILKTVGYISAGFAAWKIATNLLTSIGTLKFMLSQLGKGASLTLTITAGLILTFTGFAIEFEGIKDAIRQGLDGFNFTEIVVGGLLGTSGATILGSGIAKWLFTAFGSTKVGTVIMSIATNLGVGTASAAGAILGAAVGGIVAGVPAMFIGIYDACKNGLDWLSGILIPAGATAAGAGIGAIIGALGGPIGAGIGALIGLAVGALTDLVILVVQNWENIATWFSTNVVTPICNFFSGLWKSVSKFFSNLWNDIKGIWSSVSNWFNTTVIQPVSTLFENVTSWIGTFFEGCWIIIQAVWVVVSSWFDTNVIQPVTEFFSQLWTDVTGFFTELWNDIVEIWTPVSNWFDTNVIQPVTGFFSGLWTNVAGFFTSLWEDIKLVWETVSTWFSENVITPIQDAWEAATLAIDGFFTTLWTGIKTGVVNAMNAVIGAIESTLNWIIGGINRLINGFNNVVSACADVIGVDWGGLSTIPTVSLSRISVYESGGYPTTGQMFVAREAGPELVGNIGRKTAVVNNEQIVASVSRGVASANSEQNALLREQNSLLRAMLDKETGVYLDGKQITQSVEKYQSSRGRVIVAGGVV